MRSITRSQPLTKKFLGYLLGLWEKQTIGHKPNKEYVIVTFKRPSGKRVYRSFTEKQIQKAIYRLRGSGYILPVNDQSGKTIITLTPKAIEYSRRTLEQQMIQQRWDGWWRIVIFDVPEDARELRDHLRYSLQSLGFRMLQASVWVYPYDVFEELEKLIPDIKEHQWIKLLEARSVVGVAEKQLRKVFGL